MQVHSPPSKPSAQKAAPKARHLARVCRSIRTAALRILAPSDCLGCSQPVRQDTAFCEACVPAAVEWELDGLPGVAVGSYTGALRESVRALKYQNRGDLAEPLGALLSQLFGATLGQWSTQTDVAVPPPLHPQRLAERGYNQAALIANSFARQSGLRTCPRALRRTQPTRALTGLSAEARSGELAGSIEARMSLRPARVVLIDDVATTGATLRTCRAALEGAGAVVTAVAVIARADRRSAR